MKNPKTKNEVIEFIQRRFPEDSNWTSGNCYYFAMILKARFPEGCIMYHPIDNHFIFQYAERYYDWLGELEYSKHIVEWSKYIHEDPLHTAIIQRDCID